MLTELVSGIPLIPRTFLILRIAGLSKTDAQEQAGMSKALYDKWVCRPEFKKVYQNLDEHVATYRGEAVAFLRRSNQLATVDLERLVIDTIAKELGDGSYKDSGSLTRSNFAREVYARLMPELDKSPDKQVNVGLWEQKILNLPPGGQALLNENNPIIEADSSTEAEYTTCSPRKKNK